jgi:carbon monoxide dehydrogenase subunit G
MELDHEFTVPVPVDQAWPVLLDVERIAPCMPGATLDSVDGDEFTGRLKVKLGAMTITYKGTARIASRDEDARTVTIEGTGKEARGSGTASATVQAQLHAEGASTRVTVHTKLNVTGRPAQFGRNIMGEVGGKLIGRFAGNLATEIATPATTEEPEAAAAEPEAAAEAGETPAQPVAGNGAAKTAEATATPVEPTTNGDGTPEQTTTPAPAPKTAPAPPVTRPATPRGPDDDAINLLEFAGPSVAKRLAPVVAALAGLWVVRRLIRRKRG